MAIGRSVVRMESDLGMTLAGFKLGPGTYPLGQRCRSTLRRARDHDDWWSARRVGRCADRRDRRGGHRGRRDRVDPSLAFVTVGAFVCSARSYVTLTPLLPSWGIEDQWALASSTLSSETGV